MSITFQENNPLHMAILEEDSFKVIDLLEIGVKIFARNKNGETAYDLLKNHRNPYIKILLNIEKINQIKSEKSSSYEKINIDEANKENLNINRIKKNLKTEIKKEEDLVGWCAFIKKILEEINTLYFHRRLRASLKLFKLVSEFFLSKHYGDYIEIHFDYSISRMLLENIVELFDELNHREKESFFFQLMNIYQSLNQSVSINKKLIIELKKTLLTLIPKLEVNFVTDEEKELDELDNLFDDEYVSINAIQNKLFVCNVRVPPKTKRFVFMYVPATENSPESFERCGELISGIPFIIPNLDLHPKSFLSLEELLSSCLRITQEEVNSKRKQVLETFRTYDIKEVSLHRESSMRRLNQSQIAAMEAIRIKYSEKLEKMGGFDSVLKDYIKYLEKEFQKKAPQYMDLKLPLKHDPKIFERIPEQSLEDHAKKIKEISELYYMNPFHTAWRYFQNPNPWIDPNAQYAVHDLVELEASHAEISDEARQDLAYLWLAASDSSITPMRDMSIHNMMELFTHEIAMINRGHNWDALDSMKEGTEKRKITEEMVKKYGKIVDDLKPDNPSCEKGVVQRLMQSVLGNPITETPETRSLDTKIVKDYIAEFVAGQFKAYLSCKESQIVEKLLEIFHKEYIELEALTEKEEDLFTEFRISSSDIRKLVGNIIQFYGDRVSYLEIRVDAERYSCYEEYIWDILLKNPYDMFFERLQTIAESDLKEKRTTKTNDKSNSNPMSFFQFIHETKKQKGNIRNCIASFLDLKDLSSLSLSCKITKTFI